MAVIFKPEILS